MRVGAVNYLNSKPLIEGLGSAAGIELSLDLPSRLADQIAAGDLDVGLIPVVEYFRAGDYSFIPNVSIASRGPVHSVILSHRVPLPKIKTVALDAASKTSAALLRIMLDRFLAMNVTYLPQESAADADLWIGDHALARRAAFPAADTCPWPSRRPGPPRSRYP